MNAPLNKYLVSLYQEYYKFEMERKDRLSQLVNLPLTILIGLFGFMAYVFGNFPKSGPECIYVLFLFGLAVTCALLLASCYFMILALYGKPYDYLSSPKKIETHIVELLDFNKKQKSKKDKVIVESEIYEMLRENFSKAVEQNQASNNAKSDQILRAIRLASWSFVFSIMTIIPFLTIKHSRPNEPQEIKISNIGEISMSNETKNPGAGNNTSVKPTNGGSQKPPRPTNEKRVDNAQPKKKKS